MLTPALLLGLLPVLTPAAPVPADSCALVGGTVHTMVPGEEPRIATVLIRDQKIEVVDPDLTELPAGTERIDVTGKHLVPGLIDAMVSFDPEHDPLYLCAGVTAVRDYGGKRIQNLLQRPINVRDQAPGPSLYIASQALDGDPPSSSEAAIVRNAASAEGVLSLLLHDGPDFLHVLAGIPEDSYLRVLELAEEAELDVWGPVPGDLTVQQAIEAGHDGFFVIDQLLPKGATWPIVQPMAFDKTIALMKEHGVAIVPALHAAEIRLHDQTREEASMRLLQVLAPSYEQWWIQEVAARVPKIDENVFNDGQMGMDKRRELLVRLVREGIDVVPGSAAPYPWLFPGQALHQELDQWVRAGLSNQEVLELATVRAARALGMDDERGTIAPGLFADIVCANEDPRENLHTLIDPEIVVVRGRVLERRDVDDMLGALQEKHRTAREEMTKPLEVGPPPMPEGVVVLTGQVESWALRMRLSSERFAVVHLPDGAIAYTGRIAYPDPSSPVQEELSVQQVVRDGRLESFLVQIQQGDAVLACEGGLVGESFRIQRKMNGASMGGVEVARGQIKVLSLSSVTSLLVMGQIEVEGDYVDFDVIDFHEGLTPETARWRLGVNEQGNHLVRTHMGQMVFRFEENGAPLIQRTHSGQAIVETGLIDADTRGGPGHPLPVSMIAKVEESRAAWAEKVAEAEAAGETPPTDEGDVPPEEGGEDGPPVEGGGEEPPPTGDGGGGR